uniref:Uncharacterized protein n=1 Tax=Glossina palpalis gambiensis TaxID=67801 RepID=A0A1B0BNQ3_9MUSC
MKGLDRADQYMSYYNIFRKSCKWTQKAVLHFLNADSFNIFLIQKKIGNSRNTYKQFLLNVAIALTQWEEEESKNIDSIQARPSNIVKPTVKTAKHDPPGRLSQDMKKYKLVPIVTNGSKTCPQRKCRVHTLHSVNKRFGYTRLLIALHIDHFRQRRLVKYILQLSKLQKIYPCVLTYLKYSRNASVMFTDRGSPFEGRLPDYRLYISVAIVQCQTLNLNFAKTEFQLDKCTEYG